MTKTRSTKRALLMSALALLMCVSMLIGSTFAWFTDSVTSSGNIIKSGTLDVTMEWKDATANGAQQTYKDASEGAIFNYDKWEPGYVEAKNVKISNVGTLALKYALNIAATGEVSTLANVIDVYFAEGEIPLASRAMTELTRVGTLTEVLAGMPANMNGSLLANTSTTVTVALKMQESAGNEYQNKSIGSEFAIQLLATQMTNESDSFDNQYDKNAGWTGGISQPEQDENGVWQIGTPEELAWLAQYINGTLPAGVSSRAMLTGKDAALVADVDLNNLPWTPIGNDSTGYTGTFDGQGHTIYNLNVSGTVNVGLFGYALGGGNVKNLTVKNATVKANDYAGAIIGRGYTDIVNCHAENVNVTVTPYLTNGVYDGGAKAGAVMGQLLEGSTNTLVNCTAKNVVITGYRDLGGVLGMAGNGNDVRGCSAENVTIHYVDVDGPYDSNTPNQNAGAIVGRIHASATVDFTTEANNAFKLIVERIAKTTDELNDALANGTSIIVLSAGKYTFRETRPQIPAGTTIIGQEGVEFTNTLAGNLENVTLKNISIKADNAQRWGYATGNVVFEDCTFDAADYAIHFDTLYDANVTYKNCTIIGGAAIGKGAEQITFDGCKIYGNGTLGILRSYSHATIKNCTFDVSEVDATDTIPDGIQAVNCEIKVSNNTNVNGDMKDLYYKSGTGVITEE